MNERQQSIALAEATNIAILWLVQALISINHTRLFDYDDPRCAALIH